MSIEWAGLGPELLLALDRTRAEPLRVQLERELRGGDPVRQAGRRRTAPVVAGAGRGARDLARAGARVLQPAPGRGLSDVTHGFGDAGRGGRTRAGARRRGGRALTRAGADRSGAGAAARGGLPSRRPRPHELPARRLGARDARQLSLRHPRRARLRRSSWHRPPSSGAGRLPPARPGHGRRPGPDRDLRRLRPGHQPRASLARRRRSAAGGDRGPGRRRLPRDLLAPWDRGCSGPDRRAGHRRRRARRDRRPCGDPHPDPPVPDRHRARSGAPAGARGVGATSATA